MLPAPAPVVVVHEDLGGSVDAYASRVLTYKGRKVHVRIEGDCASACTMLAGLPPDRVCVGPKATFGFHQAYWSSSDRPSMFDVLNRSEAGTAELMRHYPRRLRDWIAGQGGLTETLIVLRGQALLQLFRPCR